MGTGKKGFTVLNLKPIVHRAATIFNLTGDRPDPSEILDALGVVGTKVYKDLPHRCPVCSCSNMATLELVGVSAKPLFWECDECGALLCAKAKWWICKRITKLYDCWTIQQDWEGQPKRKDFN